MPLPSSRAARAIAVSVSGVAVSGPCGAICGRIRPPSAPLTERPQRRPASISASWSGTESNSTWSDVRARIVTTRAKFGSIGAG